MLIILGLVLLALLYLVLRTWRGMAENCRPPFVRIADSALPNKPDGIPRIIWSFWHSEERPLVVQFCMRNWRVHNPDFEIHMLHAGNIADFIPPGSMPVNFASMTRQRQADWLRLALLERHGGIWLDASIFLTASLDWVLASQIRSEAEYVGFYIEGFTVSDKFPVIENWCIAAPQGSAFVKKWHAEFSAAIAAGDRVYLDQLKAQGIYERTLQRISMPEYLLGHVTAQYVLQNGDPCRFYLLKAEDSAYFYQAQSNWRRPRLFWRLLFLRCPPAVPAMVKLRGGERKKLEKFLRWKLYRGSSIAGTHLVQVRR